MTLGILSDLENVRHLEVGVNGGSWSHEECLVHVSGVLSELVSFGVHTDCFDAESVG